MSLCIQVPASTTNFGPGFDCLGAALQLWNRIRIQPGPGGNGNPAIVADAANLFFEQAGVKRFDFRCQIEGDVPQARGLGSSVTIRAAVLLGLNALTGNLLAKQKICELCAKLEGHPDNAAAALFGGFTIISKTRGEIVRFDVDPVLKFILFIPDFEVKTGEARKVLPETFSRQAIVENLANASLIAAAFASRRYDQLAGSFSDRLHQPFRTRFVPFLPRVLDAAERAGALGGFLSGSGSSIACLTLSNEEGIARAISEAAPEAMARIAILSADNNGAQIVEGAADA
jgi:homoserine kinase